ncbi:peptidyl-tRNA hydrolase [Cryptococcus depauperatus CBS 7841]|uniref:peptidyl-tRNA hydrolase n=1 Tax=Cryptococcus depauperatus CBS 7841 TaxID=1295531 RepID=A0AAJ8M369_9TREE
MMSSFKMEGVVPSIVFSIIAFTLGYQVHSIIASQSNRVLSAPKSKSKLRQPQAAASASDASDFESDASDSESALSSNLKDIKFDVQEGIKLVLVVNDELKMTKGKIAAQAGHATLACAMTLKDANPKLFKAWQMQGQPKIALQGASTEELETLAAQARSINLCARIIRDAGRTQVASGSKTIVGIGPGPAKLVNTITGKLKLL